MKIDLEELKIKSFEHLARTVRLMDAIGVIESFLPPEQPLPQEVPALPRAPVMKSLPASRKTTTRKISAVRNRGLSAELIRIVSLSKSPMLVNEILESLRSNGVTVHKSKGTSPESTIASLAYTACKQGRLEQGNRKVGRFYRRVYSLPKHLRGKVHIAV